MYFKIVLFNIQNMRTVLAIQNSNRYRVHKVEGFYETYLHEQACLLTGSSLEGVWHKPPQMFICMRQRVSMS